MKVESKTSAQILRRRGYSLGELSSKFGISKSTASLWTKDVDLTQLGIDRVECNRKQNMLKGHEILHNRKLKRLEQAENEADKLLKSIVLNNQIELVALAMMYWCEGIKSDRCVGFTNSDPKLARSFIILLKKLFKIDTRKIRVTLHVHDYHNKVELLEFWSSSLKIPQTQFTKIYMKKSQHKYKSTEYKGCVRIGYYDSNIARIILSFAKKFINLYI